MRRALRQTVTLARRRNVARI